MADDANKVNGADEAPVKERVKPDPPGYFEGESMTRRQRLHGRRRRRLGGLAAAAIILPAVGFAVAPIFHRGKERWEGVGPTSDFVEDTYRQVVFTETEGIGDAGKTHRLRPQELRRTWAKSRASSSPSPTAAPTSAARSASSRPPATSSARATAASTTSRASGSAARRCARSTASRPASRKGQVEVGPRYSVTSQMEPVRARDPGEFTGGIWEYLYPPRPSTFPAP